MVFTEHCQNLNMDENWNILEKKISTELKNRKLRRKRYSVLD